MKVSDRLYNAIAELDAALRAEIPGSSVDFSYNVALQGNIVARHSIEGVITPIRK